jgi:hypothetical protein
MSDARTDEPLRIGNASGFYGDRHDAVLEMLTGGPLDVLTGDYLAELTMLILGRDVLRDPARGYARTFLRQMRDALAVAAERDVKVVTTPVGSTRPGCATRSTSSPATSTSTWPSPTSPGTTCASAPQSSASARS